MKQLHSMYFVSTRKPKGKRFNMKINESLRQEFAAASEIIGLKMSQVVHQFIVKTVKEIKEKYPEEFESILNQIKEEESVEHYPPVEETKRKSNSHLSVAPSKQVLSHMEQIAIIREKSGIHVSIEPLVLYRKFLKDGDRMFFERNFPARIQELVIAYTENRLDEYLSEQAPETKTAG